MTNTCNDVVIISIRKILLSFLDLMLLFFGHGACRILVP